MYYVCEICSLPSHPIWSEHIKNAFETLVSINPDKVHSRQLLISCHVSQLFVLNFLISFTHCGHAAHSCSNALRIVVELFLFSMQPLHIVHNTVPVHSLLCMAQSSTKQSCTTHITSSCHPVLMSKNTRHSSVSHSQNNAAVLCICISRQSPRHMWK